MLSSVCTLKLREFSRTREMVKVASNSLTAFAHSYVAEAKHANGAAGCSDKCKIGWPQAAVYLAALGLVYLGPLQETVMRDVRNLGIDSSLL